MTDTRPPLHPETILAVLQTIDRGQTTLLPEELATCRAALKIVRKGQIAAGLTGDMVDTVTDGVSLLKAVGNVVTKFKGKR